MHWYPVCLLVILHPVRVSVSLNWGLNGKSKIERKKEGEEGRFYTELGHVQRPEARKTKCIFGIRAFQDQLNKD